MNKKPPAKKRVVKTDDPLAPLYEPDLDGYIFNVGAAVPQLKIHNGAAIFAQKITPEPGDIVAMFSDDQRCGFARFVRGDGFRTLADFPDGMRRLIVCKVVLVVVSIRNKQSAQ